MKEERLTTTSFHRTLTEAGLLTACGRRDAPPSASGRWAGRNPALVRMSLLAVGSGPPNSDRRVKRLKNVMPNRVLNAGIFFAVAIGSIACAAGGIANGGSSTIEAPPVEVVEGNFARAPYVLEIEVEEVRQAATFRSDSGEVGYVQYSIIGTVLEILKSSEERELLSDEIEYRFTQEYDPKADSTIAKGRKYLVFLMLADDPPRFWVIGNGAQFELCPELSKTVRQIAEQE